MWKYLKWDNVLIFYCRRMLLSRRCWTTDTFHLQVASKCIQLKGRQTVSTLIFHSHSLGCRGDQRPGWPGSSPGWAWPCPIGCGQLAPKWGACPQQSGNLRRPRHGPPARSSSSGPQGPGGGHCYSGFAGWRVWKSFRRPHGDFQGQHLHGTSWWDDFSDISCYVQAGVLQVNKPFSNKNNSLCFIYQCKSISFQTLKKKLNLSYVKIVIYCFPPSFRQSKCI